MNLRSLVTLAVAVMLPLSGCVIVSRSPGDVTFLWNFDGLTCAQVPGVANMKVEIAGQVLENNGVYPCAQAGTDGILLKSFRGGFYSWTVKALDNQSRELFRASGTMTVDGPITVNVTLKPGADAPKFAYLVWTFPPKGTNMTPTCADVGMTKVRVYIDGAQTPIEYNCADGQVQPGVRSPDLTVGMHDIDLYAVDNTGYEYYGLRSKLPIQNSPVSSQYDLEWVVGGAAVRWTVMTLGGATSTTCGAEGIVDVYVNFRDSMGNLLYADPGDRQPCTYLGQVYDALPPGTYSVFLRASGSNGSVYQSSQTNPPAVTVTAGVFRNLADGPNISLTRVQ